MSVEVDAIYTPSGESLGNPLREALPPPLGRDAVFEQLTQLPPYDESNRKKFNADEKYDQLDCIFNVFYPLTYYIDLARALDRGLRNSYAHRNPLAPRFYRQVIDASKNEKDFKVPPDIGRSDCCGFAITGDSGIGKSTATEHILKLTPQLIKHNCYKQQPFPFRQVPWIKVNCPPGGSARALCVAILRAYDRVLSTDYEGAYDRKGVNADKLMSHIVRISCWHGTGIIIIDELQNLASASSGGKQEVLAFFSHLMHSFGLPVVLIGTIAAVQLLSSEYSQARRATGYCNPIWTRLTWDDSNWRILLGALWRYQYTTIATPLDVGLSKVIHCATQGVADNVAKLLRAVQQKLVYRSPEKQVITEDIIRKTAASLFGLQSQHLQRMSGELLEIPSPDRKDGKSNRKDYLLPQELADQKAKQKANKANIEANQNGPQEVVPGSNGDKKATQLVTKPTSKPNTSVVPDPILGAHAAATKSGKSVSEILLELGVAVKTQEMV